MATIGQLDVVIQARDYATGILKNIQTQMAGIAKQATVSTNVVSNYSDKMKTMFREIQAQALKAVGTAAFAYMGKQAIQLAGDLEQTKVAFTTLTGSVEKANKIIQDLANFAKATPFELTGLEQTAKKMVGMGFEADQVIPILKILGDSVSAIGGNQDTLNGVVLAISQIKTKGKISAEEMNQLAERGLPVYDILREKLNLTQKDFEKLGSNGISAGKGIAAILEGLNEKYDGMMDKQSQTLQGVRSNIKDAMSLSLREIGSSLLPKLKQKLNDFLEWWNKNGKSIATALANSANTVFDFIIKGVGGIGESFGILFNWLSVNQNGIKGEMLKSWGSVFTFIDLGLQSIALFIYKLADKITEAFINIEYNAKLLKNSLDLLFNGLAVGIAGNIKWGVNTALVGVQGAFNKVLGLNEKIYKYKSLQEELIESSKNLEKNTGFSIKDTVKWSNSLMQQQKSVLDQYKNFSNGLIKGPAEDLIQSRADMQGQILAGDNGITKKFSMDSDAIKKLLAELAKGLKGVGAGSEEANKKAKELLQSFSKILDLQKDLAKIGLQETVAKPLSAVKAEMANIAVWINNTMQNIKNYTSEQVDEITQNILDSISAVKEEWQKSVESVENYIKSIGDGLKSNIDAIESTKGKIKELKTSWLELKKDAISQLAEIRLNLQQSLQTINTDTTGSLVDRLATVYKTIATLQEEISGSADDQLEKQKELLQVEKDIAETKKELADAEGKMNDNVVQKLKNRISQEQANLSGLDGSQKSVQLSVIDSLQSQLQTYTENAQKDIDSAKSSLEDLQDKKTELQTNEDTIEKQKQINTLTQEKLQLEKLLTQAQEARAKTLNDETETEKILREAKEKRVEAEATANEKIAILEATANSSGIDRLKLKVSEEDGLLKTYYKNRSGKWIEVLDSENQALVLSTTTKVSQYRTDLTSYITMLQKQATGTSLVVANMRKQRSEYYNYLSAQTKSTIDTMLQQVNRLNIEFKKATSQYASKGLSLPGMAVGGYTGDGGIFEAAGIVHKGEYVVPNWMVKAFGGAIQAFENVRLAGKSALSNIGFAGGGYTSNISFGNVIVNDRNDADYLANMIEKVLVRKFRNGINI